MLRQLLGQVVLRRAATFPERLKAEAFLASAGMEALRIQIILNWSGWWGAAGGVEDDLCYGGDCLSGEAMIPVSFRILSG
jgi:hypothetical protein